MDDLVGNTVLHYEILEQVGQGGLAHRSHKIFNLGVSL